MLTKLTVYTPQLSVAPFTLSSSGSPETDLLQIRSITGLEPVSADINTSKSGNLDGESFRSANVGKRNIVLTLGGNPDWSTFAPEDIRKLLETSFMSKTPVRLQFEDTSRETVEISGYVENCDAVRFSQDPEYQISIVCPNPDFVGIVDVVHTMPVPVGVVYSDTLLECIDVDYIGTVPSGVVVSIPALASGSSIHLVDFSFFKKYKNVVTGMFVEEVFVGTDHGFELSTVPKQKYARLTQSMPTPDTNVLQKVATSSQWIQLSTGTNRLRLGYTLSTVVGYTNSITPDSFENATISYRNRYGSV